MSNDNDGISLRSIKSREKGNCKGQKSPIKSLVEEAIAAYGDYVSEDSKIPNTDYILSGRQCGDKHPYT